MANLSVSEITSYLSALVASDELLSDVWVSGEISGYRPQPNSKYRYFSLKDAGAQLSCAIFRPLANLNTLREGMMIQAHGRLDVYAPRGTYSFVIDHFEPISSRGQLYEQLEQLKARLNAEGLFDAARKRPLPAFPLRVGVVTSPDTAAFQDVRNIFTRRFPLATLVVSPTLVQGADAPPMIVRAVQRFSTTPVDVVLVCRGGGSVEDLWCFNDERVVRAVAACPVPVITGVGHEIDYTLVDYAADMRAPTPSAAAELLTPDIASLRQSLTDLRHSLTDAAVVRIAGQRDQVASAERTLTLHAPQRIIDAQRRRTDELDQQMQRQALMTLQLLRERLTGREQLLSASDPRAMIRRGYALVTNERGELVRTVAQALSTGNRRLNVRVQDGRLNVIVDGASYEQPDL